MKAFTVKEIKKIIDILPDDAEVRIGLDEDVMVPVCAGIVIDEKTQKSFLEILI